MTGAARSRLSRCAARRGSRASRAPARRSRRKSGNGLVAASRSWPREKRLPEPRQLRTRAESEKAQRKRAKERDKAAHARRRARAAMRARIKQGLPAGSTAGGPDARQRDGTAPTFAPRRSTHRPVAPAAAVRGRGRSSSSAMHSARSWPPSGRLSTGWRRCCPPEPARPRYELQRRMEDLQRSFAHQDRAFAEAFERARLLDEQGMDDRRFCPPHPASFCAMTVQSSWAPGQARSDSSCTGSLFVRWVVTTYGIAPERLLVVSRGGVSGWCRLAARYTDVFSHYPEEFRAATRRRSGVSLESSTRSC